MHVTPRGHLVDGVPYQRDHLHLVGIHALGSLVEAVQREQVLGEPGQPPHLRHHQVQHLVMGAVRSRAELLASSAAVGVRSSWEVSATKRRCDASVA
ncbi:MAG: hypothetical protein WAV52_12990, partial [Luteococcus japonicus]